MQTIRDYNFYNKRTLVRLDLNIPIAKGKVLDTFKLNSVLETLFYLKNQSAKLILVSHLGRPQKKDKSLSLKPVAKELSDLLNIKVKFESMAPGKLLQKKTESMKPGDIMLLENIRFYPGEMANNRSFAKTLADLADVFVQDAFAVCHRNHASVAGAAEFLPRLIGFALEKEIEALSRVNRQPKRPLVVIIGGAKVASKIKVANQLISIADHTLFGGKVVNEILTVKGISLGRVWPKEEVAVKIYKIDLTNPKVHLPVDVLVSDRKSDGVLTRESGPGSVRKEEGIFDIGSETITTFKAIIKQAKTVFWVGPLGLVENDRFKKGTLEIAKAINENKEAFKIVGGGETVAFLRKENLIGGFSHVSTGGSAMLEYLAGEKMPGLEIFNQ